MVERVGNPVEGLNPYYLRHVAEHIEALAEHIETLAEHIEASRLVKKWHEVLALETNDRRNAWYEAREAKGDLQGYRNDVVRAWDLAVRSCSRFQIGTQCRYALIIASINSLAGNVSPGLMAALVEQNIWTRTQAFAYIGTIPDPVQQRDALSRILPGQTRIGAAEDREEGSGHIGPPWPRLVAEQVVPIVAPEPVERPNGEPLREVNPSRSGEPLLDLDAGDAPEPPEENEDWEQESSWHPEGPFRDEQLADMAPGWWELGEEGPKLPVAPEPPGLADAPDERAWASEDATMEEQIAPVEQDWAVIQAEEGAVGSEVSDVPECVQEQEEDWWSEWTLEAEAEEAAPSAPVTEPEVEPDASNEPSRADMQAYRQWLASEAQNPAAKLLRRQYKTLGKTWGETLDHQDKEEQERSRQAKLAEKQRKAAEEEAGQALQDDQQKADSLRIGLPFPHEPGSDFSFWAIDDWEEDMGDIPSEPPDWLRNGVEETEHVGSDEDWLEEAINNEDSFFLDLSPAYNIEDQSLKAEALYHLGLKLESQHDPKPGLEELLEVVQDLPDETMRDRARSGIAVGMAHYHYPFSAQPALDVLAQIENTKTRADVAREVAEELSMACTNYEDVIAAAEASLEDEEERTQFVCKFLTECYPPKKALAAALEIENQRLRLAAVSALAPHLDEPLLRQALAAACVINDSRVLAEALSQFSARKRRRARSRVLQYETSVGNGLTGGDQSDGASRKISDDTLAQALDLALAIDEGEERATAMSRIVPALSNLPVETLRVRWDSLLRVLAARSRLHVLRDLCVLAPVVRILATPKDMEELCHAIEDVGRWWP